MTASPTADNPGKKHVKRDAQSATDEPFLNRVLFSQKISSSYGPTPSPGGQASGMTGHEYCCGWA
jgi:hypothetical protein